MRVVGVAEFPIGVNPEHEIGVAVGKVADGGAAPRIMRREKGKPQSGVFAGDGAEGEHFED